MAKVRILGHLCKMCNLCISVCPHGVLAESGEISRSGRAIVAVVAEEKCTACLRCASMCPDAAIEVEADEPQPASRR